MIPGPAEETLPPWAVFASLLLEAPAAASSLDLLRLRDIWRQVLTLADSNGVQKASVNEVELHVEVAPSTWLREALVSSFTALHTALTPEHTGASAALVKEMWTSLCLVACLALELFLRREKGLFPSQNLGQHFFGSTKRFLDAFRVFGRRPRDEKARFDTLDKTLVEAEFCVPVSHAMLELRIAIRGLRQQGPSAVNSQFVFGPQLSVDDERFALRWCALAGGGVLEDRERTASTRTTRAIGPCLSLAAVLLSDSRGFWTSKLFSAHIDNLFALQAPARVLTLFCLAPIEMAPDKRALDRLILDRVLYVLGRARSAWECASSPQGSLEQEADLLPFFFMEVAPQSMPEQLSLLPLVALLANWGERAITSVAEAAAGRRVFQFVLLEALKASAQDEAARIAVVVSAGLLGGISWGQKSVTEIQLSSSLPALNSTATLALGHALLELLLKDLLNPISENSESFLSPLLPYVPDLADTTARFVAAFPSAYLPNVQTFCIACFEASFWEAATGESELIRSSSSWKSKACFLAVTTLLRHVVFHVSAQADALQLWRCLCDLHPRSLASPEHSALIDGVLRLGLKSCINPKQKIVSFVDANERDDFLWTSFADAALSDTLATIVDLELTNGTNAAVAGRLTCQLLFVNALIDKVSAHCTPDFSGCNPLLQQLLLRILAVKVNHLTLSNTLHECVRSIMFTEKGTPKCLPSSFCDLYIQSSIQNLPLPALIPPAFSANVAKLLDLVDAGRLYRHISELLVRRIREDDIPTEAQRSAISMAVRLASVNGTLLIELGTQLQNNRKKFLDAVRQSCAEVEAAIVIEHFWKGRGEMEF